MSGTVKSKTASKTDKFYQEVKDKLDGALREYKEVAGRRRILWHFEIDKRRRRIITTVAIFERDRHKANEIASDIVRFLKSRGFNVDVWPLELADYYELWNLKFAVKVEVPTTRRRRNAEPSF